VTQTPHLDTRRADARLLRLHVVPSSRLAELTGQLDTLAGQCRAPFTASHDWLRATCAAIEEHEAWAVIVRDELGDLCAAVVVLERPCGEHQLVTLADTHLGFRGSILALDDRAAALLGYGLRRQLQYRSTPTVGMLGPVASDTIGLAEFCANLGDAEVNAVDPIPLIRQTESTEARDYLSANMRRTLRKARNRLSTDGRTAVVGFTDRPDEIRDVISALHRLHVRRDHSRGLSSNLDSAEESAIWKQRLLAMADRGALELATMHIDGVLASYTLSVLDGETLSVLEGVLDPEWSRYAPGRLLETAVLQRMLDNPALTTLDWTSPVAPESLLAANGTTPISVVTMTALPVIAREPVPRRVPAQRVVRESVTSSDRQSEAASAS
jgi:CelD/BcsL family acetyltransferase involved in cellulose biosynthesis